MRLTPWIIESISVGIVVHILQRKQGLVPLDDYAESDLNVWGAKQRMSGALQEIGGTLEKTAAEFTGDDRLSLEGVVDQIAGGIRVTAGKATQAVHHKICELES
jgi:uncharacterized protein YjbJ (UPF0337 family)